MERLALTRVEALGILAGKGITFERPQISSLHDRSLERELLKVTFGGK